ncbi:MAG: beta-hydroxyacyl-ACP dehydratase [Prevotella sp.]|nr:beta-hydroxyacyl-ACP dehydratase [Prevotella sp.]
MTGTDVRELLLQREPVLVVDVLSDANADEAHTSFVVRSDNIFIREDGSMEEAGLIEHIAQSASAFAGYKAKLAGAKEPPLGYIGEVKNFSGVRRPRIGEELNTVIRTGAEVNGVSLLTAETYINNELVASTEMKIYIGREE